METVTKVLKTTGWYLYAVLATVLTLGGFLRFHLVTLRKQAIGGVRAGVFGGTHVYRDDKFLVVSTWYGKKRYPVSQISYAETGILKVRVSTSGSGSSRRRRNRDSLGTWQTRTVADFVNTQVAQ